MPPARAGNALLPAPCQTLLKSPLDKFLAIAPPQLLFALLTQYRM